MCFRHEAGVLNPRLVTRTCFIVLSVHGQTEMMVVALDADELAALKIRILSISCVHI